LPADSLSDSQLELAHVLFIDIVGYSKRLVNEQTTLVKRLNELVLQTEQCRKADAVGKLIRIPTGDGMALAFFTSPDAPVRCAMELSKADQADPKLELRMGIHTGPVDQVSDVNQRSNIAGAGINMAQRVMECGDGGHILLSKHLAEDLEHYGHWQPLLHDLGECEVKHGVRLGVVNLYQDDIGNPQLPKGFQALKKRRTRIRWAGIATALLLLAAIVAAFLIVLRKPTRWTSNAPEKSIAVLPFENLSSDKENAYFADGIQDEILTKLASIADLKVISRTSTAKYKSKPEDLKTVSQQLGVATVLEGSVQKAGDKVRVNVQLIKAANDSHLWADTFDRKLTDIFSVESEVAKAIADELRAKLTGDEEQVITAKPTNNSAAYDAYLRGLADANEAGGGYSNARKHFQEAVGLDPKFALSWAMLSYVDSAGYISLGLQPTSELREQARQAAENALTLQPNLGEALLAKGFYYYACVRDYDAAMRYYEQARRLLPNNSRLLLSLGSVARRRGEWDRNDAYFTQAEQLDPRNVDLLSNHAASYMACRRFRDALAKLDQILNIAPESQSPIVRKAAIAQAEGDLPHAAVLLGSLHPGVDSITTLEAQTYQAILERRPAEIISRLKEILAKRDPKDKYPSGELRFWLGWAQEVAGDNAGAQESWRQARSDLEPFLKDQPDNFDLLGLLALTNMGLGEKSAAFDFINRQMVLIPPEKDALVGPGPTELLVRVAARMGESDRAIAAIEKLLSTPYEYLIAVGVPLTPALIRLDPMFDPLRGDPRFKKLSQEQPQ
jgi:TolB-like protein/Tfp pilus assembly protein PilF